MLSVVIARRYGLTLDQGQGFRLRAMQHPEKLRFSDMPLLVRVAVALALFDSWVIFEEGVVDRTGLWELMPGYLRARFCPWDLAALGLIVVPLLLVVARPRRAA
jgi:hypothetical protein